MKKLLIDKTAKLFNSTIGKDVEIREYVTIHDSEIGDNCRIFERVSIKKSEIDKNTDINANTYIEFTKIENNVQIGPNCSIVGVFHKFSDKGTKRKDSFKKVIIRKKAFIGAGVIILPGREIGNGSVVGAGAVIAVNIPPFHIAVGIPPNQTIKSLKEWLKKRRSIKTTRWFSRD